MSEIQTVPEILDENAELFRTKNEDYGNSRQLSGEITDLLIQGNLTLSGQQEYAIYGLQTRLMDKLIRAFHLQWNTDTKNHESLVDTYKDLSNYAAMLAHEEMVREKESKEEWIKSAEDHDGPTCYECNAPVDDDQLAAYECNSCGSNPWRPVR